MEARDRRARVLPLERERDERAFEPNALANHGPALDELVDAEVVGGRVLECGKREVAERREHDRAEYHEFAPTSQHRRYADALLWVGRLLCWGVLQGLSSSGYATATVSTSRMCISNRIARRFMSYSF